MTRKLLLRVRAVLPWVVMVLAACVGVLIPVGVIAIALALDAFWGGVVTLVILCLFGLKLRARLESLE